MKPTRAGYYWFFRQPKWEPAEVYYYEGKLLFRLLSSKFGGSAYIGPVSVSRTDGDDWGEMLLVPSNHPITVLGNREHPKNCRCLD